MENESETMLFSSDIIDIATIGMFGYKTKENTDFVSDFIITNASYEEYEEFEQDLDKN